MRNKLLTLAVGLALVVMAGKFFAVPLLAQVRAALVQNVDEHGRIPYQSTSQNTTCTGSTAQCDVFFPAVPNNKRLVITHFDTLVFVANSGGLNFMSLGAATSINRAYPEFTDGTPITGDSTFLSSRAVEFYVDAGSAPIVHFNANQAVVPFTITLTGYLLDCTSGCAAIAQ